MKNIRKHWYYIDPIEKVKSGYCIYFNEIYKGYFDLCFQFNNIKIQLFYSTCTNNLDELVKWLKNIDSDNETIEFRIDEEGPINLITINKIISNDNNKYELIFSNNGYIFKKEIHKKIFLKKILNALYILINNKIWGINNYYGEFIKKELSNLFIKYNIKDYKECSECKERLCE